MKTIIAGSRTIESTMDVLEAMTNSGFQITEVVSGCAKGVDKIGELLATTRGIPVKKFPADWETYGRAAGPIRNGLMALYADALIAVHDGKSKGTLNMIKQAKSHNLKVYVHLVK